MFKTKSLPITHSSLYSGVTCGMKLSHEPDTDAVALYEDISSKSGR